MLTVICARCQNYEHNAECRYVEFLFSESGYSECYYARCRGTWMKIKMAFEVNPSKETENFFSHSF
jgi:hypothetical protein